MKSILIKDTTKEEREQIVKNSLQMKKMYMEIMTFVYIFFCSNA